MKTDETGENDRQERMAWDVHVVECSSGSYSDSGEPVVLMTLAHQDASCPMVLTMPDARKLAAELIISLAANGDMFAQLLLDDHFPYDREGNNHWPAAEDCRLN